MSTQFRNGRTIFSISNPRGSSSNDRNEHYFCFPNDPPLFSQFPFSPTSVSIVSAIFFRALRVRINTRSRESRVEPKGLLRACSIQSAHSCHGVALLENLTGSYPVCPSALRLQRDSDVSRTDGKRNRSSCHCSPPPRCVGPFNALI